MGTFISQEPKSDFFGEFGSVKGARKSKFLRHGALLRGLMNGHAGPSLEFLKRPDDMAPPRRGRSRGLYSGGSKLK